MTQTLKTLALSAIAGAAIAVSASASAISITNTAGTFNNWGGFDWAQNGTAVVEGFNSGVSAGDAIGAFDLTYFARAVEVTEAGTGNSISLATAGLDSIIAGLLGITPYEYTIVANLVETGTCLTDNTLFCTSASFNVVSGTFNIYYDLGMNADPLTGVGFDDGSLIISGIIGAQAGGGFDVISGGNATLAALITYTNNAFINPDLYDTTAATTLQIGANVTNWTAPSGMPNGGGTAATIPQGAILLQADGNQTFTARVPEPGVLALLGVALLGMAVTRRRKSVE